MKKIFAILLSLLTLLSCGLLSACSAEKTQPDTLDTETVWETVSEAYKEWLEARSVDILQPDLCVMGGFTEGKKVLALAQAYMIQLVPHMWGTGIGVAAGLQFIANIPATPLALFPDEPMIEYDLSENLLRDTLIGKTIKIENGTVKIPHGSGLGIKVDRNVIERFLMK